MPVTEQHVKAIAKLVRLNLDEGKTPEEASAFITRLAGQMDDIIGYIDCISEADTTQVAPLYSPLQHAAPPRADVAVKKRSTQDMLANAPEKNDTFFVVPPVL